MRQFLFLFVTLISLRLSAQRQITVRVIDSETKKPVANALVVVPGTGKKTTTNVLGFFQLTTTPEDTLFIASPKHENTIVAIPANADNFTLTLVMLKGFGQSEEDTTVSVEKAPQFPGGPNAFVNHVYQTLRYPSGARRLGIEGDVYVAIVVDSTGVIVKDEIKIIRGISAAADLEAVRIMKECPDWIPGSVDGEFTRMRTVAVIPFRLKKKYGK